MKHCTTIIMVHHVLCRCLWVHSTTAPWYEAEASRASSRRSCNSKARIQISTFFSFQDIRIYMKVSGICFSATGIEYYIRLYDIMGYVGNPLRNEWLNVCIRNKFATFGGEEDSKRLDPSVVLNQIINHPSPPHVSTGNGWSKHV